MKTKKYSLLKVISILILAVIIFGQNLSCTNEGRKVKVKNDLEKVGLKGNIKTIVEKEYLAEDSTGSKHLPCFVKKYISSYNVRGYQIERTGYDSSAKLMLKETFELNDNNELIKYHGYYVFPSGINENNKTYKYDEDGKEIECNENNPDGTLMIKHTTQYDKKGNMVESNSNWADGSLMARSTFRYDKKGNMIEGVYYSTSGIIESKEVFEYDNLGNNTLIFRYDQAGNLQHKSIHEYSAQNKLTRNVSFNPDGTVSQELLIVYDEKGNEIENNFKDQKYNTVNNELKVYDIEGNVIERTTYNNGKFIGSNKYSNFDKLGNLLRIFFINSEGASVIEREIEYY